MSQHIPKKPHERLYCLCAYRFDLFSSPCFCNFKKCRIRVAVHVQPWNTCQTEFLLSLSPLRLSRQEIQYLARLILPECVSTMHLSQHKLCISKTELTLDFHELDPPTPPKPPIRLPTVLPTGELRSIREYPEHAPSLFRSLSAAPRVGPERTARPSTVWSRWSHTKGRRRKRAGRPTAGWPCNRACLSAHAQWGPVRMSPRRAVLGKRMDCWSRKASRFAF